MLAREVIERIILRKSSIPRTSTINVINKNPLLPIPKHNVQKSHHICSVSRENDLLSTAPLERGSQQDLRCLYDRLSFNVFVRVMRPRTSRSEE